MVVKIKRRHKRAYSTLKFEKADKVIKTELILRRLYEVIDVLNVVMRHLEKINRK